MNRIQFQRGLSLSDFLADYGTEERCATAVESARWPTGFICPKCGNKRHSSYLRGNVKVFQCSICRKQTTLTEDTVFHSTKLPLTKWFQAIYFMTQTKNNISSLEMKRMIGVSYRTAWLVKQKLMQIMFEQGACKGFCVNGVGYDFGSLSSNMMAKRPIAAFQF